MPSNVTRKNRAVRPPSDQQNTVPNAAQSISQNTVPSAMPRRSYRPTRQQASANAYPSAPFQPAPAAQKRARKETENGRRWWLLGGAAVLVGLMMTCIIITAWGGWLYSGSAILPGVSSFGVDLGGKSQGEAAAALDARWREGITLQNGTRTWQVDSASLGIWIDAASTAALAEKEGRSSGSLLSALIGNAEVAPILEIDLATTYERLAEIAPQLETPPINAGVQLVNGSVQATSPQEGRMLDLDSTLASLRQDAASALADGVLELVMVPVQPTVLDSSPMVAQATQLLTNPLNITAFDPIRNEKNVWSLPPEEWSRWLVATSSSASPTGLTLTLETTQLTSYLTAQASTLGGGRYLDVDEAATEVANFVANNQTNASVRVYHEDASHVVQSGETFSSIAYDYGIPYPWIQQANPGVSDDLSAGQVITIPSPDNMLPLPIVYNKRIVVSISQQHLWAYENDQLVWDWVISTGIAESPTAPGVFQIQSHEMNAYAGNWNLWMPHFMGVYRPVPTSDFMNGFHGFPTRSGSQLLWTNSLGTRVTYGCILVSDTNVTLLYDWAQEGTVVEIQR